MSLRIVGAIGLMSGLMAAWLFYADVRERQTSHAAISQMLLIVEPQRIDLGVIGPHEVQNVLFKITNGTDLTADSIVVHESCGCTVVKNQITEIKSGEVVTLSAEFNPQGRQGPAEVHLIFEYRLSGRREQSLLTIAADIVDPTISE